MRDRYSTQLRVVPFRNSSGETIPPFAAMELDYFAEGGKSACELVDDEDLMFRCKKPSSTINTKRLVFNSEKPVPAGGTGDMQLDTFSIALADLTTALSPDDECGPVDGSWYIKKTGRGLVFRSYDSAASHYVSSTVRTIFVSPAGAPRPAWIGYLYESYRGVVAGFWVVPTLPLDGNLPPFSRVYVYNIYKWNFGIISGTVRVEADFLNNRWIALMQEYQCPDSRTIAAQTPAPADSTLTNGEP